VQWLDLIYVSRIGFLAVNTDGTTASGSTLTANQSVGGEDDALLVTVNSGTSTHEVRKAGLNTQGYSLSFEYVYRRHPTRTWIGIDSKRFWYPSVYN
jgi:hypothetical protein